MMTDIVDTHADDLANLVSVPSLTLPTPTGTTASATVTNLVTGLF